MVEQIKSEALDYLRRWRACVDVKDDLYEVLFLYVSALVQYAYDEGAKDQEGRVD